MPVIKKHTRSINACYRAFITILVCFFLCVQSQDIYAQHYTTADTTTVDSILRSASANFIDPKVSLKLAEQAINIAREINYNFGIAVGIEEKGQVAIYLGKPDDAVKLFYDALAICAANGLKYQLADLHSRLGSVFDDMGDFSRAIAEYDSALKISSSLSDKETLAGTYCNMGALMNHMHEYDKSAAYFLKAIDLLSSLHNTLMIGGISNNLGGTYVLQKKYPEALRYLFLSVHISDSMHDKGNLPIAFLNIGLCHDQTGNKDSALYYYFKSLDLFRQMADVPNEVVLLGNIGSCYETMNRITDAEKYEKESLELAKKTSNLSVISMNEYNLSNLYFKKGDYLKAYKYRDSSFINKDSLYSKEQAQALAELTTKYETKEMEQKNIVLQKENDVQKLRLERKNILVYSAFGVAILFLVIGWQIVRQNRLRTTKQKLELEQKQLLAQINPHFIFNCLNSIQQFVVQNDTLNANKYLADFALLMRQTLDNSKDGTITLRREMEYLENYLSFEHMRFEDKFTYIILSDPDINRNTTELPSMIIQPFVENAIRHGLCNLVTRKGVLSIHFYKKDGFLYCEVDDNGIGMEEAQKLKAQTFIKYQSHGMDLTRQRLALVSKMNSEDYKITIINKKGADEASAGTTIIIKFPLQT